MVPWSVNTLVSWWWWLCNQLKSETSGALPLTRSSDSSLQIAESKHSWELCCQYLQHLIETYVVTGYLLSTIVPIQSKVWHKMHGTFLKWSFLNKISLQLTKVIAWTKMAKTSKYPITRIFWLGEIDICISWIIQGKS